MNSRLLRVVAISSLLTSVLCLAFVLATSATSLAQADRKCSATYCSDNCRVQGLGCEGTCVTDPPHCTDCDPNEPCVRTFPNYCTCTLNF